ncbi:MAG: hypothetical protein ACYC91_01535 [Solirubrobacteraceae bacterium]
MKGALGPGSFLFGALLLAATLAGVGTASAILVRRRLDHLEGPPRAVALVLLSVAGLLAVHLVPLLLGVLSRLTVLAGSLLLAGLSTRLVRGGDPDDPDDRRDVVTEGQQRRSVARRVSLVLAGTGLLLTASWWAGYLEVQATLHPVSADALGFHFPGVARFIQTGTLWQTTQFLPGQAQGNYPQYGDLVMLAAVLPWRSLAFVRYCEPPLLGLAALAVYAIGRELRAPASLAALAALALVAIRPTLGPALQDVLTDPLFLATFAAGTLFLLRHGRTGRRSELVLAGAGFGIALGTKWYGLTDIPALLIPWAALALLYGRPPRALLRDGGLLLAVCLLAGGVWMLRNLVLTGNPVFDYRLSISGLTILPAPPAVIRREIGFTLMHYVVDPSILRRYVWPVFRSDFGVIGALLSGGALGAGVALALERARGHARAPESRVLLLLSGALLCGLAYALTPYSAQGFAGAPVLVSANTRYGAPALLLDAALLAWTAGRLPRALRLAVEALLLGCMLAELRHLLPVPAGRVALTAAILLALAATWWRGARARSAPGRRRTDHRMLRPSARVAVLAGSALLAGGLAYHYARVLAQRPYLPEDPTVAYVLAHAPAGTRVALTGEWTVQGLVPVAPLFGPRLANQVGYLGPFIAHRLEQYPGPGPFETALRRAWPDYLEIGTGFPPRPDPVQERWAAVAGYRTVISSARLVLMRAPGAAH